MENYYVIVFENDSGSMIEISIEDKSFVLSFDDIIIQGFSNLLKQQLNEKEFEVYSCILQNELLSELAMISNERKLNESIVNNLNHIQKIIDQIPQGDKYSLDISSLKNIQQKILNTDCYQHDILKDIINEEKFNDIKLSFKNHELKHVKQKHKTSCGIACLAMITNQNYGTVFKEVKKQFGLKRKFFSDEKIWTAYLKNYGYECKEMVKTLNWNDVSDMAIAVLKGYSYTEKYGSQDCYHAIIFRRQNGIMFFLDPDQDNILYDFWNFKMYLDGYIEIK